MQDCALLVCLGPSTKPLLGAKMGHKSWAKSNYETYNVKHFGMHQHAYVYIYIPFL